MPATKFQTHIRWTVPIVEIIGVPRPPPEGWTPPKVDGGMIVEADAQRVVYQFEREVKSYSQGDAACEAFTYARLAMGRAAPVGVGSIDDDVTFKVWRA